MNTAFQRGLAKAISYHGLGHYIYAGEDLPQTDGEARSVEEAPKPKPVPAKPKEALPTPLVAAPEDALKKFYTANKVMFTRAKTEATNDYDKVIDCISQTKTKLQKEKK